MIIINVQLVNTNSADTGIGFVLSRNHGDDSLAVGNSDTKTGDL